MTLSNKLQNIKKKNERLYNEKNNNEDNIILDKNDFNHYLEEYIKNNKEIKTELRSFIKYGLKIYVDISKKYLIIIYPK